MRKGEIAECRADLEAKTPITTQDAARASERAKDARVRAADAHHTAAGLHERSADIHRAARDHRDAAGETAWRPRLVAMPRRLKKPINCSQTTAARTARLWRATVYRGKR